MTKKGKEIKDRIDKIIESLDRNSIAGAINWADLACVEVMEINQLYPRKCKLIQILIEEADQSNPDLQGTIIEEYYKLYGDTDTILVKTTW